MRTISLLFRLVYRPRVLGTENVPSTGPLVIAANHLSFVDSVVIALVAPRRVVFLAKAEYFTGKGLRGRLVRRLFRALGAVPVERGTYHSARASLETSRRIIAEGNAFAIYPEGTRSLDGRLYRGRAGVAWLALSTGAPVVPVGLRGTERLQPVGARLPRPHRVTVHFGQPLDFSGRENTARERRRTTDEVMSAIRALTGQERVTEYNAAA
ncbi:1-acyl-sn-glycerol-3-phosphate acyltransferase [Allokutzneria sp. A3M-2-11 16]|uniref:lysophospholipid acyltransferase family protein n=1 Tax=Allokutzneria sp. A3M-2-11 16 TaxID=2962043 RepID=UPI0020B79D09|nr:lysophospholipid acyltransferase family protein [Allokutzneria sp. A3M-2-11 16]MCP3803802.1 1-acyl-sn-glycerol-3-phosphate acyltransferase [Allokutzneria sp. A3M-2-11 16]